MLDSTMNLLARLEEVRVEEEIEMPDLEETIFAQLYNVGKKENECSCI